MELSLSTQVNDKENVIIKSKPKSPTPMEEVDMALKECGFKRFQAKLLLTSYFGYCSSILVTSTVPYIMPNAECDLNMNLLMKGILSASPFVGMLFSSILAGFLTDTFGRRKFLVGGYAFMASCNLLSSLSQTYSFLLATKLFEGFVFAVAFSPTVALTSELCHSGVRDRVMLLQSSFASANHILLACLSWLILMRDWKVTFFEGQFVLNTWNFYLLIMTTFTLVSCILYSLLPESPKYLVTQHRYDEARDTLIYIYKTNTGKPAESFPYYNLWKDKVLTPVDGVKNTPKTSFSKQLSIGIENIKTLFRRPYLNSLLLFCAMYFLIMLMFNVVRMWYPQLSTIVEHYANEDSQELCTMLDAYTRDQSVKGENITAIEDCVPVKSGSETYINSIILGCVCLPPFMLSGLLVNKVGKKSLLIVGALIAIASTLGLRWSRSKFVVVALFATDMGIGIVMTSLMQAFTVEFFPTTTRTLAISITMTIGRIGSLVGNILFPVLLSMGCEVPFFSIAGVMACVTVLAIILPKVKK